MTPVNKTLTVGNDTYCWNEPMEAYSWCPTEKEQNLVPVGKQSFYCNGVMDICYCTPLIRATTLIITLGGL